MDLPLLSGLSNIDMIILIGAGLLFLVMAYIIFKQIVKAVIIGAISASIPVVLYLLGFDIELSLQTVIWFGLAGIATYFVYDVISGWMTIMRIITWPIRRALRKPASQPKEKDEKPKDFSPKDSKKDKKEKDKNKNND